MIYDYIVIGAGASGVLACINLIRNGKKVLLIEKTDRILKKILVTGNGRCNFTNINASPKNYYSQKVVLLIIFLQNIHQKKLYIFSMI